MIHQAVGSIALTKTNINRVIESAKKKQSEINNIYVITKGLPNSLRNSMKKEGC